VIYHSWYMLIEGRHVPLVELTLSEIRQNAILQKNNKHGELLVPTFDDLIDWLHLSNIGLIIEIKNCPIQYPTLAQKVLKKLKDNNLTDSSYVVSFDHNIIAGLKEISPGIRTGILYVARLANLRETIRFLNIDWLETPTDYLTKEIVELAHREKVQVCSWLTNDPEECRKLYELEVDLITTDQPDVIRKHLLDYS
jgi:glycerophosphoryl diester phosphodiesterase